MAQRPQINKLLERAFRAFSGAATHYHVYILVRRTNLKSFRYVGDPGYVAKRLDCKAKTADSNYDHPKFGPKEVAGLVVDPTVTGCTAFLSQKKYQSAIAEWTGFANAMLHPAILTLEGQRALTFIPNQKFYFVDLDPTSSKFGCLKFSCYSLLSAGKYIHGDFDLYGIVRADDSARNVAVQERRLDRDHSRSPEFFDVQHYINRHFGAPMMLHGAQESYFDEHSDEAIDVFQPNGRYLSAEDRAEISRLYETEFKGRRLFTKDGPREVVRGQFMTPS
jgi:hypothetical protein